MNASGRLNTCKSQGSTDFGWYETGARVSNAYVTYLGLGYSPGKLGVIPHGLTELHGSVSKGVIWFEMDVRTIR